MNIELIELDKPANVLWFGGPFSTDGKLVGGDRRYFDHLRDALKFIVDNDDARIKNGAWINVEGGRIDGESIRALYDRVS